MDTLPTLQQRAQQLLTKTTTRTTTKETWYWNLRKAGLTNIEAEEFVKQRLHWIG